MRVEAFRAQLVVPDGTHVDPVGGRPRGKLMMLLADLWSGVEARAAARCWSRASAPAPSDPACLCGLAEALAGCPCTRADARIETARRALEALP